ncbi:MAG: FKBP-type peptidyl-prolyl cis-trans isomerase [Candidatus Thorarchaeota archaeon]
MSLLNRRIGTLLLLALIVTSTIGAVAPISNTAQPEFMARSGDHGFSLAESMTNVSVPYVDRHYGSADGIIDPMEYAASFTDPTTGVTTYVEHNGSILYIGLEARTTGWIGIAWQNYTDTFTTAGLNNSDVVVGYVPGSPTPDYWRVLPTDAVTVHYVLSLRNGTVIQESDYPDFTSTDPVEDLNALQMYKDMILGMRLGEVRHFVIPADQAYNTVGHELYGQDLEYEITLNRISRESVVRVDNPADSSAIVFSDEHGTSTYQHLADSDQSRILAADGSDNGTVTQVEYEIFLNSTDPDDIALLDSTAVRFPVILMMGNTEELNALPVAHTYWASPFNFEITPNAPPELTVVTPEDGESLKWVAHIALNASDAFTRSANYKFDDEEWTPLAYNFLTGYWEDTVDLSAYDEGLHVIWFNATDPSNMTSVTNISITLQRPYVPLLGMQMEVERALITTEYYGTRIEDTFTIQNNGSAPIGSFDVYLPVEYSGNFLDMIPTGDQAEKIRIVRMDDTDGMMRWRIHFTDPIDFQEVFTFEITSHMHSLFRLTRPNEFEYRLEFLRYPVVPYVLKKAEFSLSFEGGGSLIPLEEPPDSSEQYLDPLTIDKFSSNLRLYTKNVEATRTTRVIVDAWGWLTYEETVSLDNTGGGALYSIPFTLPTYATNVKIYDEVGILALSERTISSRWNESRDITVNLAGDRFGDKGFEPTFKYTFYISYVVLAAPHQSAVPSGNKIDIPMGVLSDVLIRSHTVDIVMTASVIATETFGDYHLIYGVFDTSLRYVKYNSTRLNPIELSIVYVPTIGAASRPMIFSIIVGLIGVVYVARRKIELPEDVVGPKDEGFTDSQPRQTGAPPEVLKEFANAYSKKTALNMDLEKLQAARRRGKVKKREYMLREKDISKQLKEIEAQLPSLKAELVKHGTRYRDLVAQLELQDERIEGAKAGLRQLMQRKKKQRISRVAFEKSRQDYLKTIQKATSATDRILLSIQEEAGDI